jgi:rare lipoprotein A (peptidoglycan hydrolase)
VPDSWRSRAIFGVLSLLLLSTVLLANSRYLWQTGAAFGPEPDCYLVYSRESAIFREETRAEKVLYPPPAPAPAVTALPSRGGGSGEVWRGLASWYGNGDGMHGSSTASGEIFNASAYTAAHPSLPFGTRVKVTYLKTGRSVVVRINDRGPFSGGRIIDLSRAAAEAIGLRAEGVGLVELELVR